MAVQRNARLMPRFFAEIEICGRLTMQTKTRVEVRSRGENLTTPCSSFMEEWKIWSFSLFDRNRPVSEINVPSTHQDKRNPTVSVNALSERLILAEWVPVAGYSVLYEASILCDLCTICDVRNGLRPRPWGLRSTTLSRIRTCTKIVWVRRKRGARLGRPSPHRHPRQKGQYGYFLTTFQMCSNSL